MKNNSFIKTCTRVLRFDWLFDWMFEEFEKLEKHGRHGFILSQLLLYLAVAVYGFGMIVLFRFNYHLWESIGIYYGIAKVFFSFILPVGLAYLLSKLPIFNIVAFVIGLVTIFNFII